MEASRHTRKGPYRTSAGMGEGQGINARFRRCESVHDAFVRRIYMNAENSQHGGLGSRAHGCRAVPTDTPKPIATISRVYVMGSEGVRHGSGWSAGVGGS